MPYIPHTENDVNEMLSSIGVNSIDDLFDEIPKPLRNDTLNQVPVRASEMEVQRLLRKRASQDGTPLCFAGAGAYEHHIPAAVWEITTRGEFYTAYTPYQAEASQGTLQLLYEFQTMIASLNDLDVANASLYDGASALAEAVLMAVRANRKAKSKRILMPRSVHPLYRKVVNTIVCNQNIVLETIDYNRETGCIDPASLPSDPGDFVALVVPQPNYFGMLEDVDALTDWAHQHNGLVIASVNPTSLAILKPPGKWGTHGADIACGEGQPLGIPLSSGGPYFGFMSCKQDLVRQMPGRLIGRTVDMDGKPGFALTLQAREQHIRRSKATSNICTNQGLMTTAATVYMSVMGVQGLEGVAIDSHNNTLTLLERLKQIPGVESCFNGPRFHEAVIKLPASANTALQQLAQKGIVGGIALEGDYPELANCLLVCATETKTAEDMEWFASTLQSIIT